ncbi:MAG TPA: RNA polymerase sigma factor [Woeseiaceae bacterium]|nr:RNA polymerase sigma factor [Woeseiaceae bacterium]
MHKQGNRHLTGRHRELLETLPALRRFAFGLAGSRADADVLLEATVARVLQRGLPLEAELAPWCIRICRHLWMEEVRARQLREIAAQTVGSDCAAPSAERRRRSNEPAGDEDGVEVALEELSDEQRSVFELVAVEGHSYRQTAAMLDMPIGRIMHRLARARGTLIAHCVPEQGSTTNERNEES